MEFFLLAVLIAVLVGIACGLLGASREQPIPSFRPIWCSVLTGSLAWIGLTLYFVIRKSLNMETEDFISPWFTLILIPAVVVVMGVLGLVVALPVMRQTERWMQRAKKRQQVGK